MFAFEAIWVPKINNRQNATADCTFLIALCKNKFRYSFVKNHLTTLCNVYGVELIEVNAAYSSIIGNFRHGSDTCPDMIAASIEIARRSYKKFEKEDG